MHVPFTDLVGQYQGIKPEIDAAISQVLNSARFIGGEPVAEFEETFADFVGVEHCVGVGNGTDALEIALRAMDLPVGGEVIVPANSFIGSAEAVTNAGLNIRFCDVDDTYTLDPKSVEELLGPRTVAVMPVHLYGQPADMRAILELARNHGLRVIEDCAQAHGAELDGHKVGALGDMAAFSFFPGKNLGAYGDAGAIVTHDAELAGRARMLANHGRVRKYVHEFEGRNSRLDTIQASVLSVKIRHLDEWTSRRQEVARRYRTQLQRLQDLGAMALPATRAGSRPVYHLFVVRSPERDNLARHLNANGVATGIHYPIALPNLPAYESRRADPCPRATNWSAEVLSLPIGEHISDEQVDWVTETVTTFFSHG